LITKAAEIYGSQCIVASIEAKQRDGWWEAYIDNGREETGINVVDWAIELERLGAGEILLTSIDMEGTKKGFDNALIEKVYSNVNIPVIISGGAGKPDHVTDLARIVDLDAVAFASVLHYNTYGIKEIKEQMIAKGLNVRL
jgi:cyclase